MAAIRMCSVADCGKRHHAQDLCNRHYLRLLKFGDPLAGGTALGAPLAWLRSHAAFDGDDCLIWPFGGVSGRGYGTVKWNGRAERASRVMCELAHGPAPVKRLWALHSCGRGDVGCVHPQHLYWGTASQNKADTVGHGTHDRGEKNVNAKLTETAVRDIRREYGVVSIAALAERYGVAKATVINVARRRAWGWLD